MLKEELTIKKDILNNYAQVTSGLNNVKEIHMENEFQEIKLLKEKLKEIKQDNHLLSENYKKLKNDSLKLHVKILFLYFP